MVWLFIFGFGQWEKGPYLLNEDLEMGEGTMFAVSPDQHLFVLEPASCQVHVIDSDFQVVHTFSRRGKGPGEIEEAEGIVYTHRFIQGQGNHLYSLELNADDFMIIQRYDHH